MEKETFLEQPDIQTKTGDVSEQIIQEESPLQLDESGSKFGKFKDATSLLNAYNNLQKEFTRKSQKLAEFIKNNEENGNLNLSEGIISNAESNNTSNISSDNSVPIYQREEWKEQVNTFFKENNEAKKFSKEIAQLLVSDPELSLNKNCLKYAYALVEQNNHIDTAALLKNPEFLKANIFNNNDIKNEIIKEYLLGVKHNKNHLQLISGEPQKVSPTPTLNKPKNLQEASNILKQLLG